MILSPRVYQAAAQDAVEARWLQGVNRQVVKMATGTGKTPLFADMLRRLNLTGRMLVLSHREELVEQAADKLRQWNDGISVGIEKAHLHAGDARLVSASVQTLGRLNSSRLQRFNPDDFDMVVIDECHHATADSYVRVLEYFNVFKDKHKLCLGVTATPNRSDGVGLNKVFQEIVYDYSMLNAIEDGWLANVRGKRIQTTGNLDRVSTRAADFVLDELSSEVNTDSRNAEVVAGYMRYGEDRKMVGFTVDIQHAVALATAFNNYGIPAQAVWGDDPHRVEKLRAHRSGQIKLLFNCQLLTEGYDDWTIQGVLMTRPIRSEGFYTQMIGRGTRIPGDLPPHLNLHQARECGLTINKEDCLILDFVDVTSQHTLITAASLVGLGQQVDLNGRSLTSVKKDVDKVRASAPSADLSKAPSLDGLETWAVDVDLFHIGVPAELEGVTSYRWSNVGAYHYLLRIPGGDQVEVFGDMLSRFTIYGSIEGVDLGGGLFNSFEEAIKEADKRIYPLAYGNLTLIKTKAPWHSLEPKPAQLLMAKRLGLRVPAGATRGQVSGAISAVKGQGMSSNKRKARPAESWADRFGPIPTEV